MRHFRLTLFALAALLALAFVPARAAFVPSNTKAYHILNQRADLSTKDGYLVSTIETSFGVSRGQFAIITYDGQHYLYSIADKKFAHCDPATDANGWHNVALSNQTIDPFILEQSTTFADYPVRLKCAGFTLNVGGKAGQTQKGVCLNTWDRYDAGNHYSIEEVADFDPTEALATLEAALHPSSLVWKMGEPLLTAASQITSNNTENGFPPSNLLLPESDGYGTGQKIWHSSWSNPGPAPAGTDTYLQVRFAQAETDVIFTMIGSMWSSTFDTPTEVIIQGANLPDGAWTEVAHLTDMQNDFSSFSPDKYTSPHIALGAPYTYLRFVVKKTMNAANASRYDANGNPFVSLGRFQVYRAVEGEPDPVDPKSNINLLFIGNSITAGATLSSAATQAPPIVCGKLIEQATGVTTNVYNGGHSGITTLGFMPGRDDFTRLLAAAKAYQKNNGGPVYISIMLGTNDSACTTTEGAPVSPTTYGANIRAIIDALIEGVPGCKILLNYPIWYSPTTYNSAMYLQEGLDRLRSYYPVLDAIVDAYDQVFAGDRGVWEFFENNKALFTRESGNAGYFYLHPNQNGAKRLAEIWARSLLTLIQADGIEVTSPLPEWDVFSPQNDKKYTLRTARGDMGTIDGQLTSTVKSDIGATQGEFAFITRDGLTYLWSVADHAFMHRDPVPYRDDWSNLVCSNELLEPIKVNYTGTPAAYPYYLTIGDYVLNSAASTATGICANTYTPHDAGNQTAIAEAGTFDPAEALAVLDAYFANQLTVTYRIVDSEGTLRDELTATGQAGDVISEVPARVARPAYTSYSVPSPVTLARGADNVVNVLATWQLPFDVSPDLANAHWYNLALRDGANYVTADNDYRCNPTPTRADVVTDAYQWAFQGNPYDGIVVFNRSDLSKTLAKVGDRAVLADGTYRWTITESAKGFLLANADDGKYINEYGGSGGYLGFWHNVSDVGSIFSVSEVGSLTVENVKLPSGATIQIYKSDDAKANGRAILVIPGGGYAYVAGSSEGSDWAPMLNALGYTVAVLTYTTPPTAPDGPLTQARDAMAYLRQHPDECHTASGQIGVMGFSAGGHLASTVATHTEGSEAPAFQVLFYPVITMNSSTTHAGSRENLIGKNPSASLIRLYSNEKQVTEHTPRCYICYADNDATVPVVNSTSYAAALKRASVPVHVLHFATGGHGFGFKTTYEHHDEIVSDLTAWLLDQEDYLTAIPATSAVRPQPSAVYNLAGQRVASPSHGLFITQHKKWLAR